jgi:hypothetical protein
VTGLRLGAAGVLLLAVITGFVTDWEMDSQLWRWLSGLVVAWSIAVGVLSAQQLFKSGQLMWPWQSRPFQKPEDQDN